MDRPHQMPLWLYNELESVDAAVFSGDPFFDPENREVFRYYLGRWERQMKVEDESDLETELTPEDLDDL